MTQIGKIKKGKKKHISIERKWIIKMSLYENRVKDFLFKYILDRGDGVVWLAICFFPLLSIWNGFVRQYFVYFC